MGVHRENGLRYSVDLGKAYFSPRLAGIREHIVRSITESGKSSLVVDMYAGVGPITIPLLKSGINAIALDINRTAIELLKKNMDLNKVRGNIAVTDSNSISGCFREADRVIMNNPSQSIYVSRKVIASLSRDTIIHFLHIEGDEEQVTFADTRVLEKRVVHGYSPSSSLLYYRLEKI